MISNLLTLPCFPTATLTMAVACEASWFETRRPLSTWGEAPTQIYTPNYSGSRDMLV